MVIICELPKFRGSWYSEPIIRINPSTFPSYSFVRIDQGSRVKVPQLPGVVSIVSAGRELLPLADDYINSLRDGLLVHRIEPHPEVAVGDWVRIKAGPMAGTEGVWSV
jgi:transcription antitermination factor NusG